MDAGHSDSGKERLQARRRAKREVGDEQTYTDVARTAVHKEGSVKLGMEPAVSFTVVGETVTFTQHFNF